MTFNVKLIFWTKKYFFVCFI